MLNNFYDTISSTNTFGSSSASFGSSEIIIIIGIICALLLIARIIVWFLQTISK